jgi:putative copper export protein
MKTGRLVLAMIVVLVISFGLGFFLNGVLLKADYAATPSLYRPMTQMSTQFGYIVLANILIAVSMVLIYAKGVERRPWFAQGIRFGVLVWALAAAPMYLVDFAIMPVAATLVIKQLIGQLIVALIDGLAVAAIIRD